MNHLVSQSHRFGAKKGLPASGMATCLQFVEYRQVGNLLLLVKLNQEFPS